MLTDYDREQLGLPRRNNEGWTQAELKAMDTTRVLLMLEPVKHMMPMDIAGGKLTPRPTGSGE